MSKISKEDAQKKVLELSAKLSKLKKDGIKDNELEKAIALNNEIKKFKKISHPS